MFVHVWLCIVFKKKEGGREKKRPMTKGKKRLGFSGCESLKSLKANQSVSVSASSQET